MTDLNTWKSLLPAVTAGKQGAKETGGERKKAMQKNRKLPMVNT